MGNFLLAIAATILTFGIIMLGVFGLQWIIFWGLNKLFSINIPIIYLVHSIYFKR